jgi:hypothetical protein
MKELDENPPGPDTGAIACLRGFLRGTGTDHLGRSHATILAWSDDELEYTHDFIQWLFPLEVASLYHPEAPALSLAQFRELAQDVLVVAGLRRAFVRMLAFYGLQWDGPRIAKSEHWLLRSEEWAWRPNHNDLRMTRILHCLALFELRTEATAFLQMLESIIAERPQNPRRIATADYWRRAVMAGCEE